MEIILIISKNQSDSILPMIEATNGFERLWVLDRCTDNSSTLLQSYNEHFIENKEGNGFLAGRMRDFGLDYILSKEYDTVILFDGDRIPINLSKRLVENEMNKSDCSLALAEKDFREFIPSFKAYTKVITAGLIVKTNYLKKIRGFSINQGRCFNLKFDGNYGCEDWFFGYCLYAAGATVTVGPLRVSGKLPTKNIVIPTKQQMDTLTQLKKELGLC